MIYLKKALLYIPGLLVFTGAFYLDMRHNQAVCNEFSGGGCWHFVKAYWGVGLGLSITLLLANKVGAKRKVLTNFLIIATYAAFFLLVYLENLAD